jgi:hypothetical protein
MDAVIGCIGGYIFRSGHNWPNSLLPIDNTCIEDKMAKFSAPKGEAVLVMTQVTRGPWAGLMWRRPTGWQESTLVMRKIITGLPNLYTEDA